jgi:hypothetical protein
MLPPRFVGGGMKFSDLMKVPYDTSTGIIRVASLCSMLPQTPEEVAQQFYADHGRKGDFQRLYSGLRIDRLAWTLISEQGRRIANPSMNQDFRPWFESVSNRAAGVRASGWTCVDSRPRIVDHWQHHLTWIAPPIFLAGTTMGVSAEFHLVEGHTRLGLLSGLLREGLVPMESEHRLWLGR